MWLSFFTMDLKLQKGESKDWIVLLVPCLFLL